MHTQDRKTIIAWGQKLEQDLSVKFILPQDDRSQAFEVFGKQLAQSAPRIQIETQRDDQYTTPIIQTGNVQFQAIPADKILEPFLSFLSGPDSILGQLRPIVRDKLEKLRIPALLKMYITPHCPLCPTVLKQCLRLAKASEYVKLTIIDGTLFPEMATFDNIRSAPAILLEEQYRWTGSIQIEEVVEIIFDRDPSRLGAASLEDMLKNGQAARVAEMMAAGNKIFPAFLDLLVHEKWPVRLGAMVVFETIAARDRVLTAEMVSFLWQNFFPAEDTIKGDILYLLGKSGDEGVAAKLESILSGPYSVDVKEAAAAALEDLRC